MTNKEILSQGLLAECSKTEPQLINVEKYLADGADINYQSEKDGNTALMNAVDRKNESLTVFLFQHGANPFLKNHSLKMASDLAEANAPIYTTLKNYELLIATIMENVKKAKDALDHGANINFQGFGGYTALMIAVKNASLPMVELLITYKPNFYRQTDDGHNVYSFLSDSLIHKTLQVGKPLTSEEKQAFFKAINNPRGDNNDEERHELGRLKMLEESEKHPFSLNKLQFDSIKPPASEEEIALVQEYFGHPLPELYKEICRHFNGGRPNLSCYEDIDGERGEIGYFHTVATDRNKGNNIWGNISNFRSKLSKDSLPFACDSLNLSIFYLKWVEGKVQVWRLLYGELAFEYLDDYDDDDEACDYAHVLINESFDAFLESLYSLGQGVA